MPSFEPSLAGTPRGPTPVSKRPKMTRHENYSYSTVHTPKSLDRRTFDRNISISNDSVLSTRDHNNNNYTKIHQTHKSVTSNSISHNNQTIHATNNHNNTNNNTLTNNKNLHLTTQTCINQVGPTNQQIAKPPLSNTNSQTIKNSKITTPESTSPSNTVLTEQFKDSDNSPIYQKTNITRDKITDATDSTDSNLDKTRENSLICNTKSCASQATLKNVNIFDHENHSTLSSCYNKVEPDCSINHSKQPSNAALDTLVKECKSHCTHQHTSGKQSKFCSTNRHSKTQYSFNGHESKKIVRESSEIDVLNPAEIIRPKSCLIPVEKPKLEPRKSNSNKYISNLPCFSTEVPGYNIKRHSSKLRTSKNDPHTIESSTSHSHNPEQDDTEIPNTFTNPVSHQIHTDSSTNPPRNSHSRKIITSGSSSEVQHNKIDTEHTFSQNPTERYGHEIPISSGEELEVRLVDQQTQFTAYTTSNSMSLGRTAAKTASPSNLLETTTAESMSKQTSSPSQAKTTKSKIPIIKSSPDTKTFRTMNTFNTLNTLASNSMHASSPKKIKIQHNSTHRSLNLEPSNTSLNVRSGSFGLGRDASSFYYPQHAQIGGKNVSPENLNYHKVKRDYHKNTIESVKDIKRSDLISI